jgi:hypothetical protein
MGRECIYRGRWISLPRGRTSRSSVAEPGWGFPAGAGRDRLRSVDQAAGAGICDASGASTTVVTSLDLPAGRKVPRAARGVLGGLGRPCTSTPHGRHKRLHHHLLPTSTAWARRFVIVSRRERKPVLFVSPRCGSKRSGTRAHLRTRRAQARGRAYEQVPVREPRGIPSLWYIRSSAPRFFDGFSFAV